MMKIMNDHNKGGLIAAINPPTVNNSGESKTNSIVSIPSNQINEKTILVFESLASLGRIIRGEG